VVKIRNKKHKENIEDETITINKVTLWKGTSLILGILLAFSVFTGGFGSGNGLESVTGNVVKSGGGVTQVRTTLQGFRYYPDTITVQRGTTVELTIENKDTVNHGLHLPQFGVVDAIPPLTTTTVSFRAIETSTNGQAMPTCSQEHGETLTINVI